MALNKRFQSKEDFYENVTDDAAILTNTAVKINPDFYLHLALINAQRALLKDDLKTGFLQYRVIIEYAENLSESAGLLEDEYKNKLKEYTDSEEYKEATDDIKNIKLAHRKLKLITKALFSHRTITQAGKL